MKPTYEGIRRMGTTRAVGCLVFALVAGSAAGLRFGEARPDDAKLPPELAHVPADAPAFVSVRVGDLWNHPGLKALKEDFIKEEPGAVKHIASLTGIEPGELERVTFFVRDVGPDMAFGTVVTTVKPYDRKKVLATIGTTPRETKRKGRAFYTDADAQKGLYLIDERTFVQGLLADVEAAMDAGLAGKKGPLTGALHLAASKHVLAAGMAPSKINEIVGDRLPPEAEPLKPLFQANTASLTLDVDPKLQAELTMSFAGEVEAKEGAKAMKAGLEAAGAGLKPSLRGMYGPEGSDLLTRLANGLQATKVEVKSASIHAKFTADAGLRVCPIRGQAASGY